MQTNKGHIYRSKIGAELVIPISLLLGTVATIMLVNKIWVVLIVILAAALFFVHMIFTTFYRIKDDQLQVRCGLFFNRTIDIHSIKAITETRNALSSPALSLDRLDIAYSQYDHIIVSPKDKDVFIRALLMVNAGISVKRKMEQQAA